MDEAEYYPEEQTHWTDNLPIEQNEDGKWELMVPDVPSIEWSQVDMAEIEAWVNDKEDLEAEWNAEWVSAWMAYESAIQQPWNEFVSQAEKQISTGVVYDAETEAEVIAFVADNTFVNGESLTTVFPEINEFMTEYLAQANEFADMFNLDAIRITPRTLQYNYYDDYNYDYYNDDDYYYEDEPSQFEEAMQKVGEVVGEAVVSYGFDVELVESWFQNKTASWEELERQQMETKATQAKADVAEASEYIKAILDNAQADISQRVAEGQDAFESELDNKMADLKSQVNETATMSM